MKQSLKEYNLILILVFTSLHLVSTKPTVSDDGLSAAFLKQEKEYLEAMDFESIKTGAPFKEGWEKAQFDEFYGRFTANKMPKKPKDLHKVYRQTGILNMAEIRMLILYCYKDPPFYVALNTDLRNNNGNTVKYPKATSVLKGAIRKLQKHQDSRLPSITYRNEPIEIFSTYEKLLKGSEEGFLKQFTSSSKSEKIAQNFVQGPGRMIIKFKKPQVGADVDDFSTFNEEEVLLPVLAKYRVKIAKKENSKPNVVLSGPYNQGGKCSTQSGPIAACGETSGQDFNQVNLYLVSMSFILIILQ